MSTLEKVISSIIVISLIVIGLGKQVKKTKHTSFAEIPKVAILSQDDFDELRYYDYYKARLMSKELR